MALDVVSLAGLRSGALDDIRVDGPLSEPPGILVLVRLFLKNVDEKAADDFAFALRIVHSGQSRKESFFGVDADDLDPQVLGKGGHDLIPLAQSQKSVVDKDAGELVADGPMDQRRRHRGVNAAREAEDDTVRTDLPPDAADGVLNDLPWGPPAGTGTDLSHKGVDEQLAARRVIDLGMELNTVETALDILNGADRGVGSAGDDLETGGYLCHMISVTHPDRALSFDEKTVEKRAWGAAGMQVSVTKFTLAGRDDITAEMPAHQLHAVADAEHRHTEFEQFLGHGRGSRLVDRLGPAREDDPLRSESPDGRKVHVEGMQLTIDMCFAHPTGDQLSVLGTEIEDEDFFAVDVLHCCSVRSEA